MRRFAPLPGFVSKRRISRVRRHVAILQGLNSPFMMKKACVRRTRDHSFVKYPLARLARNRYESGRGPRFYSSLPSNLRNKDLDPMTSKIVRSALVAAVAVAALSVAACNKPAATEETAASEAAPAEMAPADASASAMAPAAETSASPAAATAASAG
jgi:hypothetical protein